MVTEVSTRLDPEILDQFVAGIRGRVVLPETPAYDDVRMVYNGLIDRSPAIIVQCHGTADVVEAVNFARDHDLYLSIRGGGHNVAGNAVNDGGLVVDLSGMRAIQVDPERGTVLAQGGATWGDIDRETQLHAMAVPGGQVSSTGIAGLTLHGGMGVLHRKYGLTIDNLRAVEIVTADGQVRTASAAENPDLFWAVRGAGSNFGVVTWFEYTLQPVGPEIYMAVPIFSLDDGLTVLRNYRDYGLVLPDEMGPQLLFWSVPAIEDFPAELHGKPIIAVQVVYSGDPEEGERLLQPVLEWATPLLDLSGRSPYTIAQSAFDGFFPKGGFYYWKSHLIGKLTDDIIDALLDVAANRPSPDAIINLWQLGGAISRVAPDATAFGHRDAEYLLSLDTCWFDEALTDRCIAWTRETWSNMQRFSQGGVYLNFAGWGEEKEALVRAGYGPNYDRLVELKTRYDPGNLFRMNQNIRPLEFAPAAG